MIIGLAGAKRSGKNTVAGFIADHFSEDYEVKEWSFAEDLKKSAAAALGVPSNIDPVWFCDQIKENTLIELWEYEDNEKKDHPSIVLTGREYLQWYGTEAHRDVFGSEFWVKNTIDKIRGDYRDGELPRLDIITDVRFPNEAEAIRRGAFAVDPGVVVRVRRPEIEEDEDGHASEIPLLDELVDVELWNTEGLSELEDRVISQLGILIRNDTRGQIG